MKPFMDQDFLLENDVAKKLYHEYAENMPIYDYHCHISPRMIYENYQFQNIGELMLGGDHYKWRVMLSNGVDEKFIRGDASSATRCFTGRIWSCAACSASRKS